MNTSRRLFLAKGLALIGSLPLIASTAWGQKKVFEYKYRVREFGSFNVRVAICDKGDAIKFMYLLFEHGEETGVRAETLWIKKDGTEGIISRACAGETAAVFSGQLCRRLHESFKPLEIMDKEMPEDATFDFGFRSRP